MATTKLGPIQVENVYDLLNRQFTPDPYWMTSILPKNSIVLIGGHAKAGKSFFLGNWARALSLGQDFLTPEPGYTMAPITNTRWTTPSVTNPTKVLLIDKELGSRTLQKRLTTIFQEDLIRDRDRTADLMRQNMHYVSKDSPLEVPPSFSSARGKDMIVRLCEEVQPEVVIFDPVGKMHHYDENSADGIQRLWDDFENVQERLRHLEASFIITHHFGKPQKMQYGGTPPDPLDPYNFRGSSKWFDLPDAMIMLARKPAGANPGSRNATIGWDLEMQVKPRHDEEMPRVLLGMNQIADNRVYLRNVRN